MCLELFCEQICILFVFMLCVDSVVERRSLRESVFPKLREQCRNALGLDVRVSIHSTFHLCVLLLCYSRGGTTFFFKVLPEVL